MATDRDRRLEQRVVTAAESLLERHEYVSALDVLAAIGWLPQARIDEWRQGRLECLESGISAGLPRISRAMKIFRRWARERGLKPSETAYISRTRRRRPLTFSKSGNPSIELAYRTHWVSPELSQKKLERQAARLARPPDLLVIMPLREWTCTTCGGTGDLLIMEEPGPVCMRCAELDHLVYLPAGDAGLTRRAKKESETTAVVVRFSRARKRYERRGILVEQDALARAEVQQRAADTGRRGPDASTRTTR